MANSADQGVRARYAGEIRVTWELIHHLTAAGFKPFAVDDGGDEPEYMTEPVAMIQAAFAVDESNLYFKSPAGKNRRVFLVIGNSAEEVINDHSDPRESDGFAEAMTDFFARIEAGEFAA